MARLILSLSVLLSLVVMTTGCGRNGALSPPPANMVKGNNGKMVEKPKADKPFVLDRLL